MGAIWFCVYDNTTVKFNTEFIKGFENLKHRGDSNGRSQLIFEETIRLDQINRDILKRTLKRSEIVGFKSFTFIFGYHRLAINDDSPDGDQPFEFYQGSRPGSSKILSMCNGEIYNWESLRDESEFEFESSCDCESILHLYNQVSKEEMDDHHIIQKITNKLEGEYTFVIGNNLNTFIRKQIKSYVVRDPLGLKPLYYLRKKDNSLILFVTELKGIPIQFIDDSDYEISIFPPGSYWSFNNWIESNDSGIQKYFNEFDNITYVYNDKKPETIENLYLNLNYLLKESLKKRIPKGRFAVSISGGIGSSVLANLILEILDSEFDRVEFFTVGNIELEHEADADVIVSKNLINYFKQKYNFNFKHHIVSCNDPVYINATRDRISSSLETNNSELIDNCIPFSFLYEYIHKFVPDIRVVISGEGCDELLGSDKKDDLFSELQKISTLKVDKLAGLCGLEVRLPYLDLDFVKFCLSINHELKEMVPYQVDDPTLCSPEQTRGIEKYLLRKANETSDNPLPIEFLFRQPSKADCIYTHYRF